MGPGRGGVPVRGGSRSGTPRSHRDGRMDDPGAAAGGGRAAALHHDRQVSPPDPPPPATPAPGQPPATPTLRPPRCPAALRPQRGGTGPPFATLSSPTAGRRGLPSSPPRCTGDEGDAAGTFTALRPQTLRGDIGVPRAPRLPRCAVTWAAIHLPPRGSLCPLVPSPACRRSRGRRSMSPQMGQGQRCHPAGMGPGGTRGGRRGCRSRCQDPGEGAGVLTGPGRPRLGVVGAHGGVVLSWEPEVSPRCAWRTHSPRWDPWVRPHCPWRTCK